MAIQNIFVVGSGLMGSGIAQNALTCGDNVFLNDNFVKGQGKVFSV